MLYTDEDKAFMIAAVKRKVDILKEKKALGKGDEERFMNLANYIDQDNFLNARSLDEIYKALTDLRKIYNANLEGNQNSIKIIDNIRYRVSTQLDELTKPIIENERQRA